MKNENDRDLKEKNMSFEELKEKWQQIRHALSIEELAVCTKLLASAEVYQVHSNINLLMSLDSSGLCEVLHQVAGQLRIREDVVRHHHLRHRSWAELLWRSFGVMGWVCTQCGCMMRLRAVAIYPPATTKILSGWSVNLLGLGFTGPP